MERNDLYPLFQLSVHHRAEHHCGGYPYEYGDVLTVLVRATGAKRILEVGTALGYTAACLASGNSDAHITTLDQDSIHLEIANRGWEKCGLKDQIVSQMGKAEDILPTLPGSFDLIFFDAYVPQLKMLVQFERLLKKGGLLITANLFLRDKTGGKYLRRLKTEQLWQTAVFADTALSVKLC